MSASQGKPPIRRHFWLQWLISIVIINLLFYQILAMVNGAHNTPGGVR